jgi:predicted dehydrogenase
MYRNHAYGGWMRPIPPDCDPQHVDWEMFQGEAKKVPFDPERVINWRFFWDYSGGNVYENMVHQVGFWYKALDMKIPHTVWMSGANYLSPKMQVPDTMNVSLAQPENLLFTWSSGFYNNYYETDEQVMGTKGTIVRDDLSVRFAPQGTAQGHVAEVPPEVPSRRRAASPDIVGVTDETELHMRNFFDCVRSRKQPNCPFEIGYRSAIACRMAITAYLEKRPVTWDAAREQIV